MIHRFTDYTDTESSDIVIVGAGISGLYCAWRIAQEHPTKTITIVERLNRTGGRLDTDIIQVKADQFVREEEGGMRFNYQMDELMQLTCALGLCDQIVPFPMSSKDNTNRYNVRGRSFSVQDAIDSEQLIWSELYNLAEEEIGLSPTDLVTNAFNNILYANGVTQLDGTPEQWQAFRETFT